MDALAVMRDAFDPLDGRRILDVGCGRGALAGALAGQGARVTGIDPNAEAVAAAGRAVPHATFRIASAEALPFADGVFDGIACLNALHHAADPARALREMARTVVPEGRIVVVEPLAEGTFFDLLRPIEDETEVRAGAQAAIARALADGVLACVRDIRLARTERFETVDAVLERIVAVDPARREAARTQRRTVEAAFLTAAPDETGRRAFVQPLRVHVLVPGPGRARG